MQTLLDNEETLHLARAQGKHGVTDAAMKISSQLIMKINYHDLIRLGEQKIYFNKLSSLIFL